MAKSKKDGAGGCTAADVSAGSKGPTAHHHRADITSPAAGGSGASDAPPLRAPAGGRRRRKKGTRRKHSHSAPRRQKKAKRSTTRRRSRAGLFSKNRLKVTLPLLHCLERMQPTHRSVILAHLDEPSREDIYQSVGEVLRSPEVPDARRLRLKRLLRPYKDNLRYLAREKASPVVKREKLKLIGGDGIKPVLSTAVPLLLDAFKRLDLHDCGE